MCHDAHAGEILWVVPMLCTVRKCRSGRGAGTLQEHEKTGGQSLVWEEQCIHQSKRIDKDWNRMPRRQISVLMRADSVRQSGISPPTSGCCVNASPRSAKGESKESRTLSPEGAQGSRGAGRGPRPGTSLRATRQKDF